MDWWNDIEQRVGAGAVAAIVIGGALAAHYYVRFSHSRRCHQPLDAI